MATEDGALASGSPGQPPPPDSAALGLAHELLTIYDRDRPTLADPAGDLAGMAAALAGAGLRAPRIEMTVGAALRMADERPLVTLQVIDGLPHWAMLQADRKGRGTLTLFVQRRRRRRAVNERGLRALFGVDAKAPLAWLAPEDALPMATLRADDPRLPPGPKPWWRLGRLLNLERGAIWVLTVYAAVTGLITLATPVAVQTLVNTIAFGTLIQPLVVLTAVLLVVLAVGAVLRLLQLYAVEYLERRLFVRLSMDLAARMPRVKATVADHYRPTELVNRFFDVVTVQKSSTKLLVDGLDIVLQTSIGLLLLALYHPALLVFDAVLLMAVIGVLFFLGRGATGAALEESNQKYAMAAWLEEVAGAPTTFRTPTGRGAALGRAHAIADDYLNARSSHFRRAMSQVVGLTAVQVLASAGVLGLGGWLVLEGSLTLGQLVAAELVVAVVVSGIAKLARSLMAFYDLLAGLEKVGKLVDLPLEPATGPAEDHLVPTLEIEGLTFPAKIRGAWTAPVDLTVPSGQKVAVLSRDHAPRNPLLETLFGLRAPAGGRVLLDGLPLGEGMVALRQRAALVRMPEWIVGSLRDNLCLAAPDASDQALFAALARMGLADGVADLPDGLDTHLDADGGPLDRDQQKRLAVARALLSDPEVLLVDHTLDGLCPAGLAAAARGLKAHRGTVIVVTRNPEVAEAVGDRRLSLREGRLVPREGGA
ncbi:MAG: ABC transporter ATP-binding protein [Myxococcales bacterium]|nr:ABC transporter ATP-binding protein [Myxococcales bacterium]